VVKLSCIIPHSSRTIPYSLKNIAGTDPSSKDSIYISPFMEISNGGAPLIRWAFPKWELGHGQVYNK